MKHRFLVAAIAALIVLGGGAAAGELSFGAKAGLMVADITETPSDWAQEKSSKIGFAGGVFANYAFDERFSVQPELLYTQRGVTDNLYDGFVAVDLTASFDYVELPVLLKYAFPLGGSFKPFICAGPCVAFTLSSELELSASVLSATVDFSSLTHVTDFLLVAGAGFEVPVGKASLVFDARFTRGFTNVILSGDFEVNGSTRTIEEDDFKNYGFSFTLGYRFPT